ncbi:MAG: Rieske 2Fe-2S domain-containing protein [Opitutaceae bacterium]
MDKPKSLPPSERREFIAKSCAIAIGGAITLVAPVAGTLLLLDPLRPGKQKVGAGGAVRVASLGSLPENGEPRKFSVLTEQVDAWNRTSNIPVGAIYLQRIGPDKVRALNAKCPHTGCFVNFQSGAENRFRCPCHDSTFSVDGKILVPSSPSPRALDELQVEIRNGTEVWVNFQNYRPGVHEQIPV